MSNTHSFASEFCSVPIDGQSGKHRNAFLIFLLADNPRTSVVLRIRSHFEVEAKECRLIPCCWFPKERRSRQLLSAFGLGTAHIIFRSDLR